MDNVRQTRVMWVLILLSFLNVYYLISIFMAKEHVDQSTSFTEPLEQQSQKPKVVKLQAIQQIETKSLDLAENIPSKVKPKSKKGPPTYKGKINSNSFNLYTHLNNFDARLLVVDKKGNQPFKEINNGMLINLTSNFDNYAIKSAQRVTSDLNPSLVKRWFEDVKLERPGAVLDLVIIYPKSFNAMYEKFLNQHAKNNGLNFNDLDVVEYEFQTNGIYIKRFLVDGQSIQINRFFNG